MGRLENCIEQRRALWEKMQNFLDTAERDGDTLKASAFETYEKMEADLSALDKEINILNRQNEIAARLKQPMNNPLKSGIETHNSLPRATKEYKEAFWNALKNKSVPYEVMNALQVGTASEGGYLVPDEFEQTLVQALEEENIFRRIARTVKTSSGERKIPVVATHGTAAIIGEEELITESDEAFKQVTLGAYKIATAIKVSEELLNDSVFSIDSYISSEFGRRIGRKEEEEFLIGSGTNRPTGIFAATGGAETGITAASATAITFDEIYDLYYSLKSPYRRNACWVMNDSTVKAIRKLKDSNGQYLWQPSASAGTPDTLVGCPVYTSSFVPNIETKKAPIAFGDFSYYWIAEREGINFKRLNEVYAMNGQVGFIMSERVDGKLILPEAVKTLKMA